MSFQQELETNQGGFTTLRGFLYSDGDGGWILSDEPNLKSCCVGSTSKVMRQVYLEGDFTDSNPGVVVAIKGDLQVAPKYSVGGDLLQYYTLKEASAAVEDHPNLSLAWLGFPLIVILLLLRYRHQRQ